MRFLIALLVLLLPGVAGAHETKLSSTYSVGNKTIRFKPGVVAYDRDNEITVEREPEKERMMEPSEEQVDKEQEWISPIQLMSLGKSGKKNIRTFTNRKLGQQIHHLNVVLERQKRKKRGWGERKKLLLLEVRELRRKLKGAGIG